jgi:hypothetical protein
VRQADGSYLAGGLRITPRTPANGSVSIVNMRNTSSDYNGGYRFELRGAGCEFVVELDAQ